METGEVRRPVPPPRVLAVLEQRKREREREPVAVQNVFSLLCINLSENKPPSEFSRNAAPASTQVDIGPLTGERLPCGGRGDKRKREDENDKLLTHT